MWKTKFGKCIDVSPSGYKVYQNLFYRWLTLNSDALQTVINRWAPHRPILHYLPALTLMAREFPNTCCLLGLGGAGVAHMLSPNNGFPIVAVENNDEVIDLAKRYFMVDHIENLSIVHENAANFVSTTSSQFHHLIVDLYNADHFPKECSNEDFFFHCYRILDINGFIAINLANLKEQWPIFQLVKTYFNVTVVIPVPKCANMVIIATREINKEFFESFLSNLKKLEFVNNWGHVANL